VGYDSRSGNVIYVVYVASILEACCKRLFKMFHLFRDVCCKHFDLDVAYAFIHMLQQYVPKYFICFSLLLQQVFSCCKLQVFYLDIAYVFTHVESVCSKCFICFRCMLQVFYLDVAFVAVVIHICSKRMF
jgi:energy-converting hydrogenase Eha subunit C